MREVRQYPLKMTGSQVFDIPVNAFFLHVIMEKDGPYLLAEVNTMMAEKPYTVEMFTNGKLLGPGKRKYIDSFNVKNTVWHVYVRDDDG